MSNSLPFSAPAQRNREPIANVLAQYLPSRGTVLEIASGTGQHVVYFAQKFQHLVWLPSDIDPHSRQTVEARCRHEGVHNVLAPIDLDVLGPWPQLQVEAAVVANLLHISPLAVTKTLFERLAQTLPLQGMVHVYGPFKVGGEHTAQTNEAFDASLRARDAAWGIRDLEYVIGQAAQQGLELVDQIAQPANNFSLVFVHQ